MQNPPIFNAWGSKPCHISKMMRCTENPDIVRTVYSSIFRYTQGHSAIFSHVYACWGTLRNIEAYSDIIETYWAIFRTLRNHCICSRAIFTTLAHLEHKAFSKACWTYKMIKHIQRPGMVRTVYSVFSRIFKNIQGYWCIFDHIHRCATREEAKGLLCSFLEIEKSVLVSEKMALIVSIFGLNCPFKILF